MKKFTGYQSSCLSFAWLLTAVLFFSGCSSNKQYFSFTPAPPAYVKKQTPPAETNTPAEMEAAENSPALTASTAPQEVTVLPEIAAVKKVKTQPALVHKVAAPLAKMATPAVQKKQKLTLAQKVVLHKVQKQVKKLDIKGQKNQAAAAAVSNRNAIALILIGLIVAVFGSFLGSLFYTLGVLILLVGLILLILNYV